MRNNQKGAIDLSIIIGVIVLIAMIGFVGFRIMNANDEVNETLDNAANGSALNRETTQNQNQNQTEEPTEPATTTFESKLYRDMSIELPAGWTAEEPAEYVDDDEFLNIVDGKLTLSNGSTTAELEFVTSFATGFAGANCSVEEGLVTVGDINERNQLIRHDTDDVFMYRFGVTEKSSDWEATLAQEFTNTVDGANMCVLSPFWFGFEGNELYADHEDEAGIASPVDGSEYVQAWLKEPTASGALTEDDLRELDTMMLELIRS